MIKNFKYFIFLIISVSLLFFFIIFIEWSLEKIIYKSKFKEKTGCPVIVNTSFNVRGEPIVNTPTDAFNCFMGTELDYLVIGNCILDKKIQDPNLKKNYINEFELD